MPLSYFSYCVALYYIIQNILELSDTVVAMMTEVELIPEEVTESIGYFMNCTVFNISFVQWEKWSFFPSLFFFLFLFPFFPSSFIPFCFWNKEPHIYSCYVILNPIRIKQNLLNTSSLLVMILGTGDTVDEKGIWPSVPMELIFSLFAGGSLKAFWRACHKL